jgi:putative ABC transport system permease protein
MHTLLLDLRYAVRQLIKNPGYTLVVVLMLALGIGVNTFLFTSINGYLLSPMPVNHPEQITFLAARQGGEPTQLWFVSYPDLVDFRKQADAFSDVFAHQYGLSGISNNGKTNHFFFSYVTGNFFSSLGVKPAVGRLFVPGEGEAPGADPMVVLGYSFWQKKFGGDPAILGKQVLVGGTAATVVGVVAKEFHGANYPVEMDGYATLSMITAQASSANPAAIAQSWTGFWNDRNQRPLIMMARLKPGVNRAQAQTSINVITDRLARQYPASDKGLTVRVVPERLARPNPNVDAVVPVIAGLFLVLAALVLLLACMNVANLQLIRVTIRQREMAIRAALGAGRGRLIRQMLTESLLLSILGGTAGMLLGEWSQRAILASPLLVPENSIPMTLDTNWGFDWSVFTYSLVAMVLSGVLIGLWPALRASRNTTSGLREGERGDSGGAGGSRVRRTLVVAEVAGSLVLLIASGLFVRSLERAQRTYLGFDPDNVLNLMINTAEAGYEQPHSDQFYRDLKDRVRALPGVQSASLTCYVPMGNYPPCEGGSALVEGRPLVPGEQPPQVMGSSIDPDYLQTMRVPLVSGRAFTDFDDHKAPPVAIVNQAMASRLWPGQDPIGKRFSTHGPDGPFRQVVGVARDGRYIFLGLSHQAFFYIPEGQNEGQIRTLQVRSSGVSPESLMTAVEQEVHKLDPALPILDLRTMRHSLSGTNGFYIFRVGAFFAGLMGLLGLMLAVVGVYGVVSYTASQRTREIGIRMALGASQHNIMSLVLRQGTFLVVAGVAVGLLAAAAVTRVMQNMLVDVSPTDPLTYIAVSLLLAAIALWACYVPARRAMRVDPMLALRRE